MKTSLRLFTLFTAFAATCTSQAQLVYVNFEAGTGYTAGSSIVGITPSGSGSNGTTGAWARVGGADAQFTAQTGALMSYSSGSISVNGGSQFARMVGGSAQANIALSSTIPDTTNYYFSFLMRGSGITASGEQGYVQWARDATSSAERIDAGLGGGGTSQGVYARDTNGSSGGTNVNSLQSGTPTPFSITAGTTYFAVGKLVSSGTHFNEYYLWINPTSSVTEGAGAAWASSDILSANTYNNNITHLTFRNFGMAAGDNFDVDEIRFGTSWSDVVAAVPEPATVALFAGGLAVLGIFRRRKN